MEGEYHYIVLTNETIYDWNKYTEVKGIYNTLEDAIKSINEMIEHYVCETLCDGWYEIYPELKVDEVEKTIKDKLSLQQTHKLIEIDSKDYTMTTDRSGNLLGKLSIYIQKIPLK